jgi:hypothetical protein
MTISMTAADPGLPGDKILRALARYLVLTREQLTRLLYRPTSTTFVGEHLTRLTRQGYLQMHRIPLAIAAGGTPGVWMLAPRGSRYLLDAGVTPLRSQDRPSVLHLWHLLALNDALIAFEVLDRTDPRLIVERVRHEHLLRQLAPRVTLPDGRTTTVVPDAWVDVAIAQETMGIALELDRGTEEERQWRRKITALLALAAGPYRAAFDADSMTVAVLATSGERRAAVLRRWTEAELTDCGKEHWAELFWFANADPAVIEPTDLYLGRRWVRSFDPVPRPLIELSPG